MSNLSSSLRSIVTTSPLSEVKLRANTLLVTPYFPLAYKLALVDPFQPSLTFEIPCYRLSSCINTRR